MMLRANESRQAAPRRPRAAARAKIPGLVLVALLTVPAVALGHLAPVVGGPVIGIVIGMLVRAVRDPAATFAPGIAFTSKYVLQGSVVLLGLQLSLAQLWATGRTSFPVMLGTLLLALVAAAVLGRLLGVSRELRVLIGSGTAICGGSAIAATSAVIGASEGAIAYAMSTIFAFNAIAVLTFPVLGNLLHLSQSAFGLWAGTAINDTSSVVAAGYVFGAAAGAHAVIVKLTRTTMIIPMTIALAVGNGRRRRADGPQDEAGQPNVRWQRVVPWFVLWFVLATALRSLGLVPEAVGRPLAWLAPVLITAALTAVGLSARFSQMRQTGGRPLLLGALLWVTVAVSSLLLQRAFGLL